MIQSSWKVCLQGRVTPSCSGGVSGGDAIDSGALESDVEDGSSASASGEAASAGLKGSWQIEHVSLKTGSGRWIDMKVHHKGCRITHGHHGAQREGAIG